MVQLLESFGAGPSGSWTEQQNGRRLYLLPMRPGQNEFAIVTETFKRAVRKLHAVPPASPRFLALGMSLHSELSDDADLSNSISRLRPESKRSPERGRRRGWFRSSSRPFAAWARTT